MKRNDLMFRLMFGGIGLVLFATSISAQEPKIRLSGEFFPFIRQGHWAEMIVSIQNPGPKDRTFRVNCPTMDPQTGETLFSRDVNVPAGFSRTARLAFKPGNMTKVRLSGSQSDGAASLEQSAVLRDTASQERLGQDTVVFKAIDTREKAMGIVDAYPQEGEDLSYIQKLQNGWFSSLRPLRPIQHNLPNVWYGYKQIDLLVFGQIKKNSLSPSQARAILWWVRQGGALILTGTEQAPELLAGPFGEATGVTVTGLHYADRFDIRSQEGAAVVTTPQALPMLELLPGKAEVIATANGLPLALYRRVGKGHVAVLACPAVVLKPEARDTLKFWKTLGQRFNRSPSVDMDGFDEPAKKCLQAIAGRQGPDRYVPAGMLLILTVAVVAVGLALSFKRRGEWLWILLIPGCIVIATVLWNVGNSQENPQRLSHIGLISGLGDGMAKTQMAMAYCAGPTEQKPTFTCPVETGVIDNQSVSGAVRLSQTHIQTLAEGPALVDIKLSANDDRMFQTDAVMETAGMDIQFSWGPAGLTGAAKNRLPAPVNNAVLMVNRRTYNLGTLAAEDETALSLTPARLLGDVQFPQQTGVRFSHAKPKAAKSHRSARGKAAPKPQASPIKKQPAGAIGEFTSAVVPNPLQNELIRRIIAQPVFNRQPEGEPILIGYTPLTPQNIVHHNKGDLAQQGWSIITWPISITPAASGQKVTIPPGFTQLNINNISGTSYSPGSGQFNANNNLPARIGLAVTGPASAKQLKDTHLNLKVWLQAKGFNCRILGKAKPQPVELLTRKNPAGAIALDIDNADRFMNKRGEIQLEIEIKPTGEQKVPSEYGPTYFWSISRLDATLKGTVR